MTTELAIKNITNALNIANLKGSYNLDESAEVHSALKLIIETLNNSNIIIKDLVRMGDGYITNKLYEDLIKIKQAQSESKEISDLNPAKLAGNTTNNKMNI